MMLIIIQAHLIDCFLATLGFPLTLQIQAKTKNSKKKV